MATNPVPPLQARSKAMVWILLIIDNGAVAMILASLVVALYVARHV